MPRIEIFDSHTHANTMPNSALELMGVAGVEGLALCSFTPVARNPETLSDHFEELCTFQRDRLDRYGIEAYVFVGIHPLCIPENWKKVLDFMEDYLSDTRALGVGEVGLHNFTEKEEEVLSAQLNLAKEYAVPVIVHTPLFERVRAVEKTIKLAEKAGVDFGKLVIDHTALDTIAMVNDSGAIPGLSIKPGVLSAEDVVANLDDFEAGLLNSDCANVTNTDPLAVPKAVNFMLREGVERSIVERMCWRNARDVYGL